MTTKDIDTIIRTSRAGWESIGLFLGGTASMIAALSGFTNPASKVVLATAATAIYGYGYAKSSEYEELSEDKEIILTQNRLSKRQKTKIVPIAAPTKALRASIPAAAKTIADSIQDYFLSNGLSCDFKNFYNAPSFLRFEFIPQAGQDANAFVKKQSDMAARFDWAADSSIMLTPALTVDIRKNPRQFPRYEDYPFAGSSDLLIPAGVDVYGDMRYINLSDADTPHVQVSGSSGSGKTVYMDTVIYHLMQYYDTSRVQIALMDGQAQLAKFNDCSHLLSDAACDSLTAAALMQQLQQIAREREELISRSKVPHVSAYNKRHPESALPDIVVFMDELSRFTEVDGMDKKSPEYEANVSFTKELKDASRVWRKLNMHIIAGLQNFSRDSLPTEVRKNLGCKVSFRVADEYSEKMAGVPGGSQLFGKGDALIHGVMGATKPERLQSLFLPEDFQPPINMTEAVERLELQFNMETPDNDIINRLRALCENSEDGIVTFSQASQNLRRYEMSVTDVKNLVNRLVAQGDAELHGKKSFRVH